MARRRHTWLTGTLAAIAVLVLLAIAAGNMRRPWASGPSTSDDQPTRPLRTAGFDDFFVPGNSANTDRWNAEIEVVPLGDLAMPTGRLVASDPSYDTRDFKPYTVTVPPGTYPVDMSVLHIAYLDNGQLDERVDMVRINIDPAAEVATWELALLPGQDTADLEPDQFYGYGVDSGTGALFDAEAVTVWDRLMPETFQPPDVQTPYTPGPLMSALYEDESSPDSLGVLVTDPASGLGAVAFISGWGDGAYPTWFGRDAAGNVVRVVTDMGLV